MQHVVKAGETLSRIAAMYGVTWQSIAQANNLANPNFIFTGQRLTIPVISTDGGASYGGIFGGAGAGGDLGGGVIDDGDSIGNIFTNILNGIFGGGNQTPATGNNNVPNAATAAAIEAARKKQKEQQQLLLFGVGAVVLVILLTRQ